MNLRKLAALVLTALTISSGSVWAQVVPEIPESGQLQIQALLNEKESRTPAQRKMDSRLVRFVKESRGEVFAPGANSLRPLQVLRDETGKVRLTLVVTASSPGLTAALQSAGVDVKSAFSGHGGVTMAAAAPNPAAIEALAARPDVLSVRMAVPAQLSRVTSTPKRSAADRTARVKAALPDLLASARQSLPLVGVANSQGDRAHAADTARGTYGYFGQGIRIGVLSDSFNNLGGAAADVASGDLPGPGNPNGYLTPVTMAGSGDLASGGSDEGRAMLQIVHDVAPAAQLYYATAFNSEPDFAANIIALQAAGCNVIIDDVFYFDESPFQDGIVAQAVNTVTAAGALYFSSAGNQGNALMSTSTTWEGDFVDAGNPIVIPGNAKVGSLHSFGGAAPVYANPVLDSNGSAYVMNWADPLGGSGNDYDFFITNSTFTTVFDFGTDVQSGTQDPFEISAGSAFSGDQVVIFKTTAAAARAIHLGTIGSRLSKATTGGTFGHSCAVNAFGTAATPAAAQFGAPTPPGPFPGTFTGANRVENFSSDGPRRIFYTPAGVLIGSGTPLFATATAGTTLAKPDITAADGVATTLPGASGLNPFYGTSAAAPHAGAIAGLLKSAGATNAQVRTILTTTAVPIDNAATAGAGIIRALNAFQSLNPTPIVTLTQGTTTVTELIGNANGTPDAGETLNVVLQVLNLTGAPANTVAISLLGGLNYTVVSGGPVPLGTIPGGGNASNAGTPFVVRVNCGGPVTLNFGATYTGGNSPQTFTTTITVGLLVSVTTTLDGVAPPANPAYAAITGAQTGRLNRFTPASACGVPEANPGLASAVGARQFDAYTFNNTGTSAACYAVRVDNAGIALFVASYSSAGFVPATPNVNWVGDSGSSAASKSFSVSNPPGLFTIVVHEVNTGGGIGLSYTLDVVNTSCSATGGGGGSGTLASTITISSTPNPSLVGQTVTLTANVVNSNPQFTPGGTIQFRDGGTVLGTAPVNLLGNATFLTSTLSVGSHSITAAYSGDVNFAPNLSSIRTQVVNPLPASTTALASSVNPSNLGQAVTFTATVTSSGGTPAGTVTFRDGDTTIGTGTLNGSGVATFATNSLTVGTHAITAVYGGSASIATSTSSALSQVVNANTTTTTLTSSKNPAKSGDSVTFSATVSPSAATGTVTFKDGAATLGTGTLSGGIATYTTAALSVGVHSITAAYGGDATYASSTSAALSQSVTNPGGCTSGGADTLCVQQNGRFTIKVAWTNQYAGNTTGVGTAFAVTSDSGFFTFFSANNIELVVKVLDGTQVNGKFWVLYGALSDVGYTITVTDTQTGAVKTYVNAPGTLASVADTTAFAARPGQAVSGDEAAATYGELASLQLRETLDAEAQAGRSGRAPAPLAVAGACSTSGGTLCLNAGRFSVTTTWQNYNDGSTGTGTAVSLTGDSGYFWFFNSANVELMLKVLDGTAVNGKFWFLSGALSDVGYTITVTDTTNGTQKAYTNPVKSLKSFIDINAF